MLNIISSVPAPIKRFSKNFEEVFGKHQLENFQTYLLGLCLELKRKNLQAIGNCKLKGNYDSLHHFLSQSSWDEEKLNEKRLKLIQRDRRTRTSQKGALIIDDTGCKKTGTYTEGAKPQRLGSEGRITNCNIVVTSHYVDETKDFPISLVPYIPQDKFKKKETPSEFHTKIDFAIELIKDALQKGIQFREVLIDNRYLCKKVVGFCERKNLYWFSNLKRNDILLPKEKKEKSKESEKARKKENKKVS